MYMTELKSFLCFAPITEILLTYCFISLLSFRFLVGIRYFEKIQNDSSTQFNTES